MLKQSCFVMALTFMFAGNPTAMAGDGGGGAGHGKTVRIRDTVNGLCVTVGDRTNSTAPVTMETCRNNDPDQKWKLDREGGPNTFRFISKSTHLCLTDPGGSSSPNATACSNSLNQRFIITLFLSNFTFQLFNRGSNECLEVGGAGNTNLQSNPCDDESDQKWRLELLKSKHPRVLDDSVLGIEEFGDAVDDTDE
ncbi:RICIN domain-containing protein [Nannocystis radixulma]|uniref:RICIN domain-containing protein n=1 Tax=Nannocystis radixulma TaxID=2995305 RepID=A0ABT5BAR0_9BACT|nr:RICIN domain-containing protein [Nannocystis radixulma]MDC0670589.1 RICIN domain-containing protein [Nannocystis radixulma]